MSDPALPMQEAVVRALREDAALRQIVAGRVYDDVPGDQPGATALFPYVTFGEARSDIPRADCLDGTEHTFTLYAWSRAQGYPECKRMAAAIRAALHDADLHVMGFVLHDLSLEATDYRRDDDGSSVAALTFRALLDPVD